MACFFVCHQIIHVRKIMGGKYVILFDKYFDSLSKRVV